MISIKCTRCTTKCLFDIYVYTMGSHTFKGAAMWSYHVERDRPGEYTVNHVHCVLALGQIHTEYDQHKETQKTQAMNEEKVFAIGSMYRRARPWLDI